VSSSTVAEVFTIPIQAGKIDPPKKKGEEVAVSWSSKQKDFRTGYRFVRAV
jgi:hypothetical protein